MGLTVTAMGLEKKKQHELKKHAATIHCSNTLSLLQRKISNALLYHAYPELIAKEEHEITIKELCKLISYHGNNHAAIREALKGLLSTVIEWNVVNDTTGQEDWTASSILASVSLVGPNCFYAYSPRMKQLLHSPTMFGKINLFIQSHFKSSYGLALYENCIRYRGLGFTKWFEMSLFRKLMGVPDDKYTIFRDFKRRVLDKSVEEVNTYSDLIVEPEVCREGRAVTKVRFSLKERSKKVRLGTQQKNQEESALYRVNELGDQLIAQCGLSMEQANQVLQDYSQAYIFEKMAILEASKNYQQGKINNIAAYFLSALKNNYQLPKTSQQPAVQLQQQHLDQSKQQRAMKKIEKAYAKYRENMIDQVIEELDVGDYSHFIQEFRDYATDTIRTILKLRRNRYTQESVLQAPQIKAMVRHFALQKFPHLKARIQTIEQFTAAWVTQNKPTKIIT